MMHLVRLYYMAFDILEQEKVVTRRDEEHDLLMAIRNGEFLIGEEPSKEFYQMLDSLDARFLKAKETTK